MPSSAAPTDAKLLQVLVEGTAGTTGLPFFRALVKGLAEALGTAGAWVTEYLPETQRLRAIALRLDGEWVPHYEYDVRGTPCGAAIEQRVVFHVADQVADLFPADNDLRPLGAVSYIGVAFFDESGAQLLGHLAVFDRQPMSDAECWLRIFRIFAHRAGAELRRLNLERELQARTEELDAVVESTMDAILILNDELDVVRANGSAARLLGTTDLTGQVVDRFLSVRGAEKLEQALIDVRAAPATARHQLWIPGELELLTTGGEKLASEGTLSRFDLKGRTYFTLVLRSIADRLEAEAKLRLLRDQSDYLQEEIEQHFGEIIGESPPMRRVVRDVTEVAGTDATVLIHGETGTGKELVARAVHRASRRRDRPLIKVNCAAIPAQLIESEFFGHEKGAFTGAMARREGRFALADGGTLFLDEIGELPLELQSKLLRVLQEGEFEPVGSSRTRRVDVRVIAATNRDLRHEADQGRFREDLYYRLGVFPIEVPPLRTRGMDIQLLAHALVKKFSLRHGRRCARLSTTDLERLGSYPWPGNVRELSNVIERAVITGDGDRINLDRALPAAPETSETPSAPKSVPPRILTAPEFEAWERENLQRALDRCHGRVSGPGGAAALLGLKPSTLTSRLKALGLRPVRVIPSAP
jgi:transcriptional regulator with PAS, ATPase and Fis domain